MSYESDIDDVLQEIYAVSSNTPAPVAVSIDPPPAVLGYLQLVDRNGRACAMMGYDLAEKLGWLDAKRPTESPVPIIPWKDYGNPRQG